MVELNVQWLSIIGGTVIPLVVALVTKRMADGSLKSVVNLVLSLLTATVATLVDNEGVIEKEWLANAFTTWVTSIASYYGLWKQTLAPAIANATRGFGLGAEIDRRHLLGRRVTDPVEPGVGGIVQ